MFKVKRARSVIHSVAHHAVSALSWLHPRLAEECAAQSIKEFSFDILNRKISTPGFEPSNETSNTLTALVSTFQRIAKTEGIELNQLNDASISFGFTKEHWPYYCCCSLSSTCGKRISVKVDGFGNKYGLRSKAREILS